MITELEISKLEEEIIFHNAKWVIDEPVYLHWFGLLRENVLMEVRVGSTA